MRTKDYLSTPIYKGLRSSVSGTRVKEIYIYIYFYENDIHNNICIIYKIIIIYLKLLIKTNIKNINKI